MPFVALIIGIWILVAGVRNTQDVLFGLIKGDFSGSDNFVFWFLAILIIGSLGYIPRLKPVSTAFIALLLVVLFLKKGSSSGVGGGFFQQFLTGIQGTQTTGAGSTPSTASLNNQIQTQINTLRNSIQNTITQEQNMMNNGATS